jgi:hypothetical protein
VVALVDRFLLFSTSKQISMIVETEQYIYFPAPLNDQGINMATKEIIL